MVVKHVLMSALQYKKCTSKISLNDDDVLEVHNANIDCRRQTSEYLRS